MATATTNGSGFLGAEGELGALLSGYYADIVAAVGDPLKNINIVIENVQWVMKGDDVAVDKTKQGWLNKSLPFLWLLRSTEIYVQDVSCFCHGLFWQLSP